MKIASAIYYFALHVKGAGAFPPPLSAEREAELLEKAGTATTARATSL